MDDIIARFMSKVDRTDDCWLWLAYINKDTGYGYFRHRLAHRASHELFIGPIPEGLHIDHLCRVRRCVNPEHLEAVTQKENNRRSMGRSAIVARTGVCMRGHDLVGDNLLVISTTGVQQCRKCIRIRWHEARERNPELRKRDSEYARRTRLKRIERERLEREAMVEYREATGADNG